MLDKKELTVILEAKRAKGKVFCFKTTSAVMKKIKAVRQILKNGADFSVCRDEGKSIAMWLVENFPKLEQAVKGDAYVLRRMGRLMGSGNGALLFYGFFREITRKAELLSEDFVDEVFEVCNGYDGGIDIKNGISLVYLLRLAVCEKICDCFEGAQAGECDKYSCLSRIENMFISLDNLLLFDDERVLRNNPIEKTLLQDPSGLYSKLTPETKTVYRDNLSSLASKKHISQRICAKELVDRCLADKGEDRHIGKYLCDKPKGGGAYLFLLVFLTALMTGLLCMISPLLILCVFSVYGCTRLILDKFYTRFFMKKFRLCEIDLGEIPKGYGVMVVVTTLLSGDENDEQVFSNLERMYHSNGGENVYFGILCDLCDSDTRSTEKDAGIIQSASQRILSLRKKYGDSFFFFVRERKYSISEKRYIAPERKRGAVMALTEFLCGKSDRFSYESIKPDEKICENIKYVLTLDADTNLTFGSLKRMAGIMMHPCNTPRLDEKKAVVTKGYGILQPCVNPTVETSGRTFFSSVMCGHGGIDGYSSARIDAAMSLFGQSIFCGKGMFEKECFYKTLCKDNAFAENEILSHDAPEGARLRCAYAPDIVLTDSFPAEELSFYKRQHRWIRGDVQNIPFLFGRVRTASGQRIKNGISPAARFFMWHNVCCAIIPVFTLIIIAMSVFAEYSVGVLLVTVAMSVYMLPFVYSAFSLAKRHIWQNVRRVFYSQRIYTGLWTEFVRMLFRICALPKTAAVSLDAISRSVFRLVVSRKKLLEWTTSAQSDAEKNDGLLGYVKKNLVSAFFGTLLFVISQNGFVRLISLLWLFLPVFAYLSGKRTHDIKRPLTDMQRETLTVYARDMWRFFSENVSPLTNHLPPDNICVYPDRRMARMTSPTNIGLYLVSMVCARKMGFIDSRELEGRLINTLSTVKKLESCKGLLYNWYDIFTAEPMNPKYVSSVDLGNYAASLLCVIGAADEYRNELEHFDEISALCNYLVKRCNPSLLYDKSRNLFYIGLTDCDGKYEYDRNRYDMLMSESRILSFVSVAKRWVPVKHYSSLARSYTRADGYMGLCSWSGTAFEFFMPRLFIPSKEGSLVYEAERFAYGRMRAGGLRTREGYVFGISESCYNELDSAANYKYHAFGIPDIAMRVYKKQNVISAYSSFLFLPLSVKQVLSSLDALKKLGAYGEYGFYESVDFERHSKNEQYGIVRCFMSHHIGMSIAACANALCENAVSDWFLKDKNTESAISLNDEIIPYDAYVKKIPRRVYHVYENNAHEQRTHRLVSGIFARLKSDNVTVYAKRDRLEVKVFDDILLSSGKHFPSSLSYFHICVDIDGEVFAFDKRCNLSSGDGRIRLYRNVELNSGDKFEISLSVTLENNTCDIARFKTAVRRFSGKSSKKITCRISFYPLVDTKENSLVCSFFDKSDTVTEMANNGSAVYFRRNSRGLCFFAGSVAGNKKRAWIKDEMICLEAESIKTEKEYETEFAICISGSKKCAEMGLVRCTENSFDKACALLCNKNIKNQMPSHNTKAKGRMKDVKGYSMVKEKYRISLPIDSGEKPYILLCGEKMCALLSEKGLGMTFASDINKRRVTYFSGIKNDEIYGERLRIGSFDLCKNACEVTCLPYAMVYKGEYRGHSYSVTCFVSDKLACKTVIVRTDYCGGICFEAVPSRKCDGKRYVGSGIAFFTGHKEAEEAEKGFVMGFANFSDGKMTGAEYDVSKNVCAYFDEKGEKSEGPVEYVFCTGLANDREIYELYKRIPADSKNLLDDARAFYEKIRFDASKMPEKLQSVLPEYFVFPRDNACYRSFAVTDMAMSIFDALLLVYTKSSKAAEKLDEISDKSIIGFLSGILFSLAVSEYIRVSKDYSFAEKIKRGETVYRRCLGFLLGEKKENSLDSLYAVCLENFARLCEDFGDVRTAQALKDRASDFDEGRKDGILL